MDMREFETKVERWVGLNKKDAVLWFLGEILRFELRGGYDKKNNFAKHCRRVIRDIRSGRLKTPLKSVQVLPSSRSHLKVLAAAEWVDSNGFKRCEHKMKPLHSCPYTADLDNDNTKTCRCCEACQEACSDEL